MEVFKNLVDVPVCGATALLTTPKLGQALQEETRRSFN